ncbi:galactose oxidase-like domain-containing protein [Embleya sp. NPDC005575]|uniref:galactose oxidase-like domain-containing protein n=1 Tax=Embleya sp. NPDC005575 TaxID=3156892 RepID=UPI0033B5F912
MELAPGTYVFQQMSGPPATFTFDVTPDGLVTYDPASDGFLAGRLTGTLIVHGFIITVDGRALSHDLIPVLPGNSDPLSRDSTHELTLIPGDYRLALVSSVADFAFALAIDGRVSVEPRFTGFAEAAEQTLTIHGYRITVDGRALSHDLIPVLPGNSDPLSRDSTHELTLIPDEVYRFLPRDAGMSFTVTLDIYGAVSVVPGGLIVQRSPLQDRLLDDFSTGLDSFAVPLSTTTDRRQTGAMLGGERSTSVTNLASPKGAPARFDVGGAGRGLQVTLGVDQQARVQVGYGLRNDGTPAPLGVNLHDGGVDRLRITTSRVSGSTDAKVTIFTSAGPSSARVRSSGGLIEFRFVDFTGPGSQDFTDVSHIVFEFISVGSLTLDEIEACGPHRVSHLMSWNPRTDESGKLAVHAALVHTGKIVFFSGDEHDPGRHFLGRSDRRHIDSTRIYDCRSGAVRVLPSPEVPPDARSPDLFCCGHALLPDGRLLVAGGTETWAFGLGDPDPGGHHVNQHFTGLRYTWIFDPEAPPGANPWIRVADMRDGRWYPTLVTLGDGDCLALWGHPSQATHGVHSNHDVEVFSGRSKSWTVLGLLPVSNQATLVYPRLHVLTNGEVFFATPMEGACKVWNRFASTQLRDIAQPPLDVDYHGFSTTSVLLPLNPPHYEPRILLYGAAQPVVISPLDDKAEWKVTSPRQPIAGSRFRKRFFSTAVILPTGEIMACGGFDVGDGRAMLETELYDPATGEWTTLPDTGTAKVERGYHSVALLMPDGRVFTAGSNDHADWSYHNQSKYPVIEGQPLPDLPKTEADIVNGATVDNRETRIEIYDPPYIGRSDRPRISSTPSSITYGSSFLVDTSDDVERIHRVALLRAGSATHAFNSDQRYVGLGFTRRSGQLEVTAPPNGNVAPPGWYLLFIAATADSQVVPSEGVFVHLSVGARDPVLIQSNFGEQGNFEVVAPLTGGGLGLFFRDNDSPAMSWAGPFQFGTGLGNVDGVAMIQSNFAGGNLEVVARVGSQLFHLVRSSKAPLIWGEPIAIAPASGVSGNPVLIQSNFGEQGNFEVVAPLTGGGLGLFFRDNDSPAMSWAGPFQFGTGLGNVDGVTMIQSNFAGGNLEVVARVGSQLFHLVRSSEPPLIWGEPIAIV